MATDIVNFRLRLHPKEHERLRTQAQRAGIRVQHLLREHLSDLLRGEQPPATRIWLFNLRLRIEDLRLTAQAHTETLAMLDARIHSLEPGSLHRTWLQEARDTTARHLTKTQARIRELEKETETMSTPVLFAAPLGLAAIDFTIPTLVTIIGITLAGLYIAHRRGLRLPGMSRELTKTERDAIQVPHEPDPRARGGREPPEYASAAEFERLYLHSAHFLATRIDRFLEQEGSEEAFRQFCEDHDFVAVGKDRQAVQLHIRAFTDAQLSKLPPDLRRDIESKRLRRVTNTPTVTITPGSNGRHKQTTNDGGDEE